MEVDEMLYDGNNRIKYLINAEQLCWKTGTFDVKPRQVCALAFRLKGTANMLCAGKRYYLDAGDILYMPQGLGYQVEYGETQMFAFHFVTERDDPAPEVYTMKNRTHLHQLFVKAASLWAAKEPGYVSFCTAILYEVLGMICAENVESEMPAHFQKALAYIHQKFREPITITQLCETVRISPTGFRQLFHTHYGVSPTEYIRKLRLEYARNLIAGGASVEQAASECGIPDPKYFARLVKKVYDCTPRQLKIYGK